MNRQYTRDDFLRMLHLVHDSFDRPALTTDIIVGFPGETDAEFAQTLGIVNRARFIHTHAFSYSPRPKTAAARWTSDFIHGPIVNERIERLTELARQHSFEFRLQFLNETVEVLVEHQNDEARSLNLQHGRCERYFDVYFDYPEALAGESVKVQIERVTPQRTHARLA
jgi:threonylcarbamoyladenosine tRNA methylthiotransferase MtaB